MSACRQNFSLLERIGLEVQKQLYDIGVDVQFEVVPIQEYDARIREGRFEAVLVDMISGPTFARPYVFWRSRAVAKGSECLRIRKRGDRAAVRDSTHLDE